MRPRSKTLTEQELEIMKIIWERGRATVRDVYETLLERRRVAYTTVMTMMNILEQKGHLKAKTGRQSVPVRVGETTCPGAARDGARVRGPRI
jgi:predicted transcriptional regulator